METSTSAPAPQRPGLPRSLLIVAGVESGPARYRVDNLLEELAILGVKATALHHHDQDALQLSAESEVVLFQRVHWDDYLSRVISRARGAGALTVFGIDDLLFEPARLPPFVSGLERDEAQGWLHSVRSYRRVFDACEAFLGSTDALSRAAAALGKRAFMHRNALSRELIELSRTAAAKARAQRSQGPQIVRLGYFSGTRTHGRDFAQVALALSRVLSARPKARLVLVGALELPRELERFGPRIERHPVVPWRQLPELIAQVDVNLAPLELDDQFCDAKSELKWFEAAAAGVVTVASPTEPFKLAIRDGENGFLASTREEWEVKLLALVDNAELRERVALGAQEDALARYGPRASAERLDQTLRELFATRSSPALRAGTRVTAGDLALLKAAGLGIGKAAAVPRDAVAGPDQLAIRHASHPVTGQYTLSQTLDFPAGTLFRVDFLVGTHRRLNSHLIQLRVLDAHNNEQLAYASAEAGDACDNAWFAFELEPVKLREPRTLSLLVEAPAALPTEGLAFWHEPSAKGRGRAGEQGKLDFTLRTWLRPEGFVAPQQPPDPLDGAEAGSPAAALLLLARARAERDARRELEQRLRRVEERAALAQLELQATRTELELVRRVVPGMERLRGTLPYKAARKLYRLLKP